MVESKLKDGSSVWSGEYESLPLSARLKLLRSRKQISNSVNKISLDGEENGCISSEEENMLPGQIRKEMFLDAKMLDSPSFQASDSSLNYLSSPSSSGLCVVSHGDGNYDRDFTSPTSSSDFMCNDRSSGSDLVKSTLQDRVVTYVPYKVYENGVALAISVKSSTSSSPVCTQDTKGKQEISDYFDDGLENIVLRERRQMLLSRLSVKSQRPCNQPWSAEMPNFSLFSADAVQQSVLNITGDSSGEQSIAGNLHAENMDLYFASNSSKSDITCTFGAMNKSSALSSDRLHVEESVESKISTSDNKLHDTEANLRSKALPSNIRVKIEHFLSNEYDDRGDYVTQNSTSNVIPLKRDLGVDDVAAKDESDSLPSTDRPKLSPTRKCRLSVSRDLNDQNKTEPPSDKQEIGLLNAVKLSISESNDYRLSKLTEHKPSNRQEKGTYDSKSVSSFPSAISVKTEPALSTEIGQEEKTYQGNSPSLILLPLKTEETTYMEASEDELDHMSLWDRLMLLFTETSPSSKKSKNLRWPIRNASSILGSGLGVLESDESVTVTRPRKRRRTATNSAETALEEDVPGLLKVLIDKGVSVEDIKLYGEPESDEVIDETLCEDSFTELEAVIWKIFSQRESLLKVTPLCCSKETKVIYCLGCLLSLVEQARILRSKKWPAEWGWSRDLQAFIFVFEKHNRIVLERPEYGYATYFFEMLDSVSVVWQIRRLVTAMKLTGCGRISLLENRVLTVGEDLSEGEAGVLAQYGWVPNTGLATMLNYCGRVVHDTNKERDGNEWRQKIGKMLVDGYNGGCLLPRFDVKKPEENEESTPFPEVKMEI